MKKTTASFVALVLAALVLGAEGPGAQDKGETAAGELTQSSQAALAKLTATVPLAKILAPKAHAVLVFPKVTKAGLGIGGQYGEGALLKGGKAAAYDKTTGASFGLQAGGQQYGYAMFFMNENGCVGARQSEWFRSGRRTERRAGGRGHGEDHDHHDDEGRYLRVRFGQKGLMAGLGIQGNRIKTITPK